MKLKQPRLKTLFIIALFVWLMVGTLSLVVHIVTFINEHEFRSPLILQSPFYKEDIKSPVVEKEASESAGIVKHSSTTEKEQEEVVLLGEHTEITAIADKIFTLESSRGKNDGCRDKGLYNGYGYAQSTFMWKCYETRDEVLGHVLSWIQDKLNKGFRTPELLCYYNEGIKKNDCPYYQKYLSL